MHIAKVERSGRWLLWSGLFLAVLMAAVLLSSDVSASQAETPLAALQMSKTVDPPAVAPGQTPAPLYTLIFTNANATEVVLDAITDTLPAGFEFVGLWPSSDWKVSPADSTEPEIVWTGPITVPAAGRLSLIYSVFVPGSVLPSTTPYVNTAEARAEDATYLGPQSAELLVGSADFGLDKEVWPTRVFNGGTVTYTVVFSNSGQLSATVETITDTLDSSLTFVEMTAGSDIATDPQEILGKLVWPDNFDVLPGETVTLQYQVQTSADPGWSWPRNRVEALVGDEVSTAQATVEVGPEKDYVYLPMLFKNFMYASLSVAKGASPTTVTTAAGQIVTYTVTIKNEGDTTGTLLTIKDALPSGFTFVGMASGSDVTSNPAGTTGNITWSGNWQMWAGRQIRLIYRVTASQTEGTYTNSASVTASNAFVQAEAASAAVTVESAVLFEDHFNRNMDRWTPFLNYWRLKPGQWYWDSDDGYDGGGVSHNCYAVDGKEAEDGLLMYLGEGAEDWTDYRIETKMILHTVNYPHGVWVRGHYKDVGDENSGGWVTGYYVVVGGGVDSGRHYVSLRQLQTETDCWGNACDNPQNLYDFNNTHDLATTKMDGKLQRDRWYTLTVEVRGAQIQVWLDGVLYIDYEDTKEPFLTGTVGLKTYKADTVSFDDVVVTPLN